MTNALVAGAAGAVTTTLLHEAVRRTVPAAPRVDLLGMQALAKLTQAAGNEAPAGRSLYVLTLLGDLVSNALYFALCGLAGGRAPLAGAALGIAGGAGAVALPGPLGLSAVTTNRTGATRALTVALYTAGGLAAGAVFAASARSSKG